MRAAEASTKQPATQHRLLAAKAEVVSPVHAKISHLCSRGPRARGCRIHSHWDQLAVTDEGSVRERDRVRRTRCSGLPLGNYLHRHFYYPNEDAVQYLYESYPGIISPLDGVTDQHFIVWMRAASLPSFRKLYGVIGDKGSLFQSGDTFTFNIETNLDVTVFDGQKSLVLTNLGTYSKNKFIGYSFWIGGISLFSFAALIVLKEHCFL